MLFVSHMLCQQHVGSLQNTEAPSGLRAWPISAVSGAHELATHAARRFDFRFQGLG